MKSTKNDIDWAINILPNRISTVVSFPLNSLLTFTNSNTISVDKISKIIEIIM